MPDPLEMFAPEPVDRPRSLASSTDGTAFRPRILGRCLADVEPTLIRWVWEKRIPRGRLTVIAGDGGTGKSHATLSIAAILSVGGPWPDQPGKRFDPASTLLISSEDDASDTIRPRLDRSGADCSRIHLVEAVERTEGGGLEYFSLLSDMGALEAKIEAVGARLCIVDPVTAHVAGADTHRDASVRGILGPLACVASRADCAVVTILHTNKGSGTKAAHRVSGSLGFTNAARMCWIIGAHPDDDTRRLMLPYKHNIIERPSGIGFQIIEGAVRWSPEPIDIEADQLLANDNESGSERAKAVDWLVEYLALGPMPVAEIKSAAEAHCISWRSIERAKRVAGVISQREGYGKAGRFTWKLPDVAANDSIDRQPESGGQWDNRLKTAVLPIDRQLQDLAVNEDVGRRNGTQAKGIL